MQNGMDATKHKHCCSLSILQRDKFNAFFQKWCQKDVQKMLYSKFSFNQLLTDLVRITVFCDS